MGNYTELFYHFVWATRQRQPFITPEVEQPLYDFVRYKCKTLEGTVHAVNGLSDHVHLACTLPAALALSDFVRKIKGSSAYFINEQAKQENNLQMCLYWQSGFGALTLEEQILPRVIAYVDNQKRRHAAGRLSAKLEQCDDGHP